LERCRHAAAERHFQSRCPAGQLPGHACTFRGTRSAALLSASCSRVRSRLPPRSTHPQAAHGPAHSAQCNLAGWCRAPFDDSQSDSIIYPPPSVQASSQHLCDFLRYTALTSQQQHKQCWIGSGVGASQNLRTECELPLRVNNSQCFAQWFDHATTHPQAVVVLGKAGRRGCGR
jgi:hypothetical protein